MKRTLALPLICFLGIALISCGPHQSSPGGSISPPQSPPGGSISKVANYDFVGQTADIPAASMTFNVPVDQPGSYWLTCYETVTQAAGTSSTMPSCNIGWTDADANVAETGVVFASNAGNTVGTHGRGAGFPFPKGGTQLTIFTSGYASSGSPQMQFSLHVTVEFVGDLPAPGGIVSTSAQLPQLVAAFDFTNQTADISASSMTYNVPAGQSGLYWLSCREVIQVAGGTSGTMPSCGDSWTDTDIGSGLTGKVCLASTNNVVAQDCRGATFALAQAGTAFSANTSGYSSSGSPAMQYSVHIRILYLGPVLPIGSIAGNASSLSNTLSPVLALSVNLIGQTDNVTVAPVYTVPSNGPGIFWLNCYTILTVPSVTSSTLPACNVQFTELDSNASQSITVGQSGQTANMTGTRSGGTTGQSVAGFVSAPTGTALSIGTTGYASSPANTMQYDYHVRVIYIGAGPPI